MDHPTVVAIQKAPPLSAALSGKLTKWATITDAEVAEIREALGAPKGTKVAPKIEEIVDPKTGQVVLTRCTRVCVEPIVYENGDELHITIHYDKVGRARTELYVEGAPNGGLTQEQVEQRMAICIE